MLQSPPRGLCSCWGSNSLLGGAEAPGRRPLPSGGPRRSQAGSVETECSPEAAPSGCLRAGLPGPPEATARAGGTQEGFLEEAPVWRGLGAGLRNAGGGAAGPRMHPEVRGPPRPWQGPWGLKAGGWGSWARSPGATIMRGLSRDRVGPPAAPCGGPTGRPRAGPVWAALLCGAAGDLVARSGILMGFHHHSWTVRPEIRGGRHCADSSRAEGPRPRQEAGGGDVWVLGSPRGWHM